MRVQSSRRPVALGIAAFIACSLLLGAHWATAHGGRLSLTFWGLFTRPAVKCQRTIAAHLNRCAIRVLSEWVRCQNSLLAEQTCDLEATNAAIDAARIEALDAIDADCNSQQSAELGFLGVIEVQSDISRSCLRTQSILSALAYPTPASHGATVNQCVAQTASAMPRLLRFAGEQWQTAFNRMARRNIPFTRKQQSIVATRRHIDHARQELAALLEAKCSAADFRGIYGRDQSAFLEDVAHEAECIAGAAYVQDKIHCDPTPTATAIATPTPSVVAN